MHVPEKDAHALLGASSAHCWSNCAAALRAQKGIVDRGSKAADEGTAVHDLSAWALMNGKHPSEYPEPTIDVHGTPWKITAEMIKNAQTYVQSVRDELGDGTLLVEQRVCYGPLVFGEKDMFFDSPEGLKRVSPKDVAWGTSDAVILRDKQIRIKDYKNGANPNNVVEATDNPQLKLYALGALYEYEAVGDYDSVHMSISQPRLNHFPEHEESIDDLREFGKSLNTAGRRALELYYREAEPELSDYSPSDDACKWCKRASTCPALLANVEIETRDFFAPMVAGEEPQTVVLAEVQEDLLSRAMRLVGLWETACKAVRAETERRLLAGQPVPGFKLVEGRRGARAWSSEEDAEATLKSMKLKVDEMYDFKLISPTKAEKVLKESPRRWAKLQPLITQSEGKPSVAPASDKRPALQIAQAGSAFDTLASVEDLV